MVRIKQPRALGSGLKSYFKLDTFRFKFPTRPRQRWSRDDAVMRALASHQCGPGSILGPGVMWDEFVVSSRPCSEGFLRFYVLHKKTTFPNSIWNQWMKSHSVEMPLQNSNLRSNSPPLGKPFTSTSVLPGHCK